MVLVANNLLAFGNECRERDATAGRTYPERKSLKDSINKTKGTILCTICADHSRVAPRVRIQTKSGPDAHRGKMGIDVTTEIVSQIHPP